MRILKWFDDVEDKFRASMREVPENLERIISVLDEVSNQEVLGVNRGREVLVKVAPKYDVSQVLQFGQL